MNSSLLYILSSKTFAAILLFVLSTTVIVTTVLAPPESPLFEGDFAPFYAAATLLKNPATASFIYDIDSLVEVQKQLWPHMEGVYLVGYPPYTIALFIPLTYFSPLFAKFLFVLLSLVAVVLSALILVRLFQPKRDIRIQTIAALLCFAPLFHSVFGGQNSALSLLLFIITTYCFIKKSPGGDLLAGATLGLWLFKPHFALVLILGFLIAKRYAILPTLALMTFGYYGVATYYLGVDWPLLWLRGLESFVPNDFSNNSHQMMSLLGVAKAWIIRLQLNESLNNLLVGLALLGSAALLLLALRTLYNAPNSSEGYQAHALALLGNIAILTSPHTLYYDSVLLLPSAFLWIQEADEKKRTLTIIALLLISALIVANKSTFPFSPFIFLSIFLAVYSLKKLASEARIEMQ